MAIEKVSIGNCIIFALALAEVTSWTIDLPEVRKYIFENNEHQIDKEKKYEEFKFKKDENDRPLFYNNIEGNSKHNTKHYEDVYENTEYAREYGYQSYMEKKVLGIVYNGSVYLEGLRKSLENYTTFLEQCNRMNLTQQASQNSTSWRPPIDLPTNVSSNATILNATMLNATRCREATRTSEAVRRLSELATWATRDLQDVAYARKYNKGDEHSLSMEENELILKLAWFLDRLAHITGYEPEPKDFVQQEDATTTSSTTTAAPASLVSASPETTRQMMDCLNQNSSTPAVDRCRYSGDLPPVVQLMMEMNSNITGIPVSPSSSNLNERVMPISRSDAASEQSMEILVASDNLTPSLILPPSLTAAVRNIRKRSISSMVAEKSAPNFNLETPSDENHPAIHFLKYYAKHKVWQGSNSNIVKSFQEFDVKNNLDSHRIQKRALEHKKFKHLRLPENPYQDLSKYVKHKSGVNYVKDDALLEKIRASLEKIDRKPSSSKKNLHKKLTELIRPKRSITFEKDVDLPRESVDPQKDISYYTKNKSDRNYNNDVQQAVRVRAGLEQVFNTGNIEVVRRFGSNYNPANPNPFMAGVLISQADFRK